MDKVFLVLHILVAIALVAVVLLQEGKDAGMKGISGASAESDSFFSRNSGRTRASMLAKLTASLAILFLITTVILYILYA